MIFRVEKKVVMGLPKLLEQALKFVYDREHMSLSDTHDLEDALRVWRDKTALDIDLGRVDEVDAKQLAAISFLLVQNGEGKLDRRKWLFKTNGIDYRKVYNLPGSHSPRDYVRGEKLAKEAEQRDERSN